MNEKTRLKILIGAACAVLVLLATAVALMLGSRASAPDVDAFQPESTLSTVETQPPTGSTGGASQDEKPTEPTKESQLPTENVGTSNPTEPTRKPQSPTEGAGSSQETDPTERPQSPTEGTGSSQETEPTEKPQSPTESTEPSQETEPTEKPQSPTEDTEPSQEIEPTEEQPTSPEEQSPSVVIPPETNPQTGEELGISFPCPIPEYDIIIEKMDPYNGIFVEDGSNAPIENVAMLLVKNAGELPVEYIQIRVMCGQEELLFDISALPAGEKLVVQEKTGKTISESKATSATALVVQRADMEMSEGKVQVTDNGDNTLTVRNLTNKTIPTVRIFYKYYMEDQALFVGGIAFSLRISRLAPGASVTIQPSHYTSQTSRVVMVLTYDSEV